MRLVEFNDMHPSDIAGLYQEIRWIDLVDGQTYEFELISYFKAVPYAYKKGGYVYFAAVPQKHYDLPSIDEGNIIKLHFSYRTFTNAIMVLSPNKRIATLRKNLGENNLVIRFIKHTSHRMEILDFYPKENTARLRDEADRLVYENEVFGDRTS